MMLGILWYHWILATLFVVLCFLLMGVILLQRGRGVGLAGAFGGAGGHTAFGSKTGDFLTWVTIVLAAIVLIYAVILNYLFVPIRAPLPGPTAQAPVPAETAPPLAPSSLPPDGAAPSPPVGEPAPGGSGRPEGSRQVEAPPDRPPEPEGQPASGQRPG